jgi:Tfp pilus assembly pilus retraction ATPase PilT
MYSVIQSNQGLGMQTLNQDLKDLVAKGEISKEEVRGHGSARDQKRDSRF